jgi:hypothetical protein
MMFARIRDVIRIVSHRNQDADKWVGICSTRRYRLWIRIRIRVRRWLLSGFLGGGELVSGKLPEASIRRG